MTDGRALTGGVLEAAKRLLKAGVRIEEQLARTLSKCDMINHHVCAAVSLTLTKLVQDIAGTPLVLARYISDPDALRCIIICFHHILTKARPDELRTPYELAAAEESARRMCAEHQLPAEVGEMAAVLVAEIFSAFQKLDTVLQPPFVKKCHNAAVLRRRVQHFLRSVQADIFVVAFASLKLSVCMRAMAEGCFLMKHTDKQLLEGLLGQVQAKARALASLNDIHRQTILTATKMAGSRR